jgi:hypothetical protein
MLACGLEVPFKYSRNYAAYDDVFFAGDRDERILAE